MEALKIIAQYVDLEEAHFKEAIFYLVLNFLALFALPLLQFKWQLFAKVCRENNDTAADLMAFLLINLSCMRNYRFYLAIANNRVFEVENYEIVLKLAGVVLFVLSVALLNLSFFRLGIRGMYFGDHFGYKLKQRITEFPYNRMNHPNHLGTNMFFLSLSLIMLSPAGVLLTALNQVLFLVLEIVENWKLEHLYPVENKSN